MTQDQKETVAAWIVRCLLCPLTIPLFLAITLILSPIFYAVNLFLKFGKPESWWSATKRTFKKFVLLED